MSLKELGRLETDVMKAVWRLGRATVRQVRDALSGERNFAYTTILTTLRNLERKRYVRHDAEGRTHVFVPVVEERTVARSALEGVLVTLFDGSKARLVDALFEETDLTEDEMRDLRRKILDLRGEEESDG
jgi:BlaI family transcriptional regulator, penicillinase repressor